MSTYWHLECLSHTPPIRSADEVSQHTDAKLDRVRELWADRDTLTAAPDLFALMESLFPTFNNPSARETTSADYFGPHAVRFIVEHPRCFVRLVNEYGGTQPVSPGPEPHVAEAFRRGDQFGWECYTCEAENLADDAAAAERAAESHMRPKLDDALTDIIDRGRQWSAATFGPGTRLKGLLDHIRKELLEVEANPTDVAEWIDVAILAFDGAWRNSGLEPAEIAEAMLAKYERNRRREWPDWRTMSQDAAIEHIRAAEPARPR